MNANLAALLYLAAGVLFILALRGLSSPASSRRGNFYGMLGMGIAVGTTLIAATAAAGWFTWFLIVLGIAIGGGAGAFIARRIAMTQMPQLVAAFHSLVGLAAVFVAAGAVVSPGTEVPSGAIAMGVPAKIKLDAAPVELIEASVLAYAENTHWYNAELRRIG